MRLPSASYPKDVVIDLVAETGSVWLVSRFSPSYAKVVTRFSGSVDEVEVAGVVVAVTHLAQLAVGRVQVRVLDQLAEAVVQLGGGAAEAVGLAHGAAGHVVAELADDTGRVDHARHLAERSRR